MHKISLSLTIILCHLRVKLAKMNDMIKYSLNVKDIFTCTYIADVVGIRFVKMSLDTKMLFSDPFFKVGVWHCPPEKLLVRTL